jgi:dienelactone hydrolase
MRFMRLSLDRWKTPLGAVGSVVDRAWCAAVGAFASSVQPGSPVTWLGDEAVRHASRRDAASLEAMLFEPADRAPSVLTLPGRLGSEQLLWPSDAAPRVAQTTAWAFLTPANAVARAHAWLHATPRPVAILVHGYSMGRLSAEARIFRVRKLFDAGMDVVLPILPFHGDRSVGGVMHRFPSVDQAHSVDAAAQSIRDLVQLVAWLRHRGHPSVGIAGVSLGGYVAALAGTVIPDLAFLAAITPLADVVTTAGHAPPSAHELPAAVAAVTPLHRKPLIAPERTLWIAAARDGVTPNARHVAPLARHFGAELTVVAGSHLVPVGWFDSVRLTHALASSGGARDGARRGHPDAGASTRG